MADAQAEAKWDAEREAKRVDDYFRNGGVEKLDFTVPSFDNVTGSSETPVDLSQLFTPKQLAAMSSATGGNKTGALSDLVLRDGDSAKFEFIQAMPPGAYRSSSPAEPPSGTPNRFIQRSGQDPRYPEPQLDGITPEEIARYNALATGYNQYVHGGGLDMDRGLIFGSVTYHGLKAAGFSEEAALSAGEMLNGLGIVAGSLAGNTPLSFGAQRPSFPRRFDFDFYETNSSAASRSGRFTNIVPRNMSEANFVANAETTFADSPVWRSMIRFQGELVIQRSDIELNSTNLAQMKGGRAPLVRDWKGDWEPVQLHHVGRQTGKMIEVLRSQNTYNRTDGGVLHIPGSGGPVRSQGYTSAYWRQRYADLTKPNSASK